MSNFDVVQRILLTRPRDTIEARAVARLSMEGSRKFLAALKKPPAPNKQLRALAREFGDEVGGQMADVSQ